MIELDGDYGEAGGALVRVALALSALTGQEFKVTKIRSGRKDSGLKSQHLTAIKTLKELCRAETNDVQMGSTELRFKPGKIKKGIYDVDIGTAGSITLLLQALILPSIFAPGKVTFNITGGTCGKWQASVDYLQNILLPYLHRFVEKIEIKILRRGYYPKGLGSIRLEISPRFNLHKYESFSALRDELPFKVQKILLLEQGKLEQIRGIVNVSSELQEKDVGDRIKNAALGGLKQYNVPANIRVEYAKAESIGGEVLVWGIFSAGGKVDYDNPVILAGDALIEPQKSSEEIGKEAAGELKKQIDAGAAVDYHLADQLIQFMGLLPGSQMKAGELSKHAQTNMYVVEKFLPVGFKVENNMVSVMEKQ